MVIRNITQKRIVVNLMNDNLKYIKTDKKYLNFLFISVLVIIGYSFFIIDDFCNKNALFATLDLQDRLRSVIGESYFLEVNPSFDDFYQLAYFSCMSGNFSEIEIQIKTIVKTTDEYIQRNEFNES